MSKPKQHVVIFVLIDGNKILVEKRPVKGFTDHQYLLPGGAIEKGEADNLESALKREMLEELGVIPIEYKLLSSEGVTGMFDNLLKPYIVTKWEGSLPNIGLDLKDPYPLEWLEFDIVSNTPIEGSRKIVDAVKEYLISSKPKI